MTPSAFSVLTPQESPGLLLWQVTITWQRSIKKALAPYEITHPQFTLLAILLWLEENDQEATQVLLMRLSKLDKMTVSQTLKALATLNYLKRREHPEDTRAKLVSLTVEGSRLAQQLVSLIEEIDREFFDVLPKDKQETFLHLLNHIIESHENG